MRNEQSIIFTKEAISKDVQLKAKSSKSVQCKGSSHASWFFC
ncbi:class III lanthipeptide [Niallia circulans]